MSGLDAAWLIRGAARLRQSRALAGLSGAVAAALLFAAIATRAGAAPATVMALALLAGLATAGYARWRFRHAPLTPELLAGYVDRAVPQAEESAALLLREESGLALLARMQRRRTAAALAGLAAPPDLPRGPVRPFLRLTLVLAMTAAGVALLPFPGAHTGGARSPTAGSGTLDRAGSGTIPALTGVHLTVRPPQYTGHPARRLATWDADVEEGAELTWELGVSGPTTGGRLTSAAGDTVPLTGSGPAGYVARLTARRSTLYRILLDRGVGPPVASDDHRLTVRLDAAPVVAIVRPDQRTAVRPGMSHRIPVEVLATDDFGVDSATLVATVTQGQGEGVKFREQRLSFDGRSPADQHGVLLHRTLDLGALGLEPGDELYFHVLVTDRRSPVPNRTRSETVFITLVDTTREQLVPGSGVALNLPPDFFRSQRQLIIDTEKLLKDRGSIPFDVFRDRSNGLGIDQGLLRLRYGQFMGDEFEGSPVSGREAHAHDNEPAPPKQPGEPAPDPLAGLRHEHDSPDNATLLAPQIKAKLREAITEMWSSELRLRTTDPKASLPSQYRSLALLQEIRQNARSYVKRVGFDPPPLEPDRKRLTGDLSRIAAPVRQETVPEAPREPNLRAGIALLQRLRLGGAPGKGDRELLEAAGTELARLAVEDPVHLLEPLRALRTTIASLENPITRCGQCLSTAERGFWRALPAAAPRAGARSERSGALALEYYRLLQAPR